MELDKETQEMADVFEDLQTECWQLFVKKQLDYGPRNIGDLYERFGMTSLLVRMNDKMQRLINLTSKESDPNNESIEDSLKDLANYSLIGLMLLRGHWPNVAGAGEQQASGPVRLKSKKPKSPPLIDEDVFRKWLESEPRRGILPFYPPGSPYWPWGPEWKDHYRITCKGSNFTASDHTNIKKDEEKFNFNTKRSSRLEPVREPSKDKIFGTVNNTHIITNEGEFITGDSNERETKSTS